MAEPDASEVIATLNNLLGIYWTGYAQHQTHLELVESWGLHGLAAGMSVHISDEPVTIANLLNRLLDLDGAPAFTLGVPKIGTTLREVLDNDMAGQRTARPGLNAAAEVAAGAHDATTRILIEQILADEELHLSWLRTEVDLFDKLGEALYTANRLEGSAAPAP
jgi:bacterioferritin